MSRYRPSEKDNGAGDCDFGVTGVCRSDGLYDVPHPWAWGSIVSLLEILNSMFWNDWHSGPGSGGDHPGLSYAFRMGPECR